MRPSFTRGFRLHHNGRHLDGAEFPSGRVCVLDDPEYGGRVEWPGDQLVPTALIENLVHIVAQVAATAPSPESEAATRRQRAREVLGRVAQYLGRDVVDRATEGKPDGR
ncbi:hypothetical protein ACF1BS_04410 [Streptomyces sp. NPDC014748]|uniref:hypothetical protein n=1 Tax=Streptomyces sp. NPDC014748 TaxID=3364905 RepID=UPI0036FAE5BF